MHAESVSISTGKGGEPKVISVRASKATLQRVPRVARRMLCSLLGQGIALHS